MADTRKCVFCGRGKVTLEHVWPHWIIELIAERFTDTSVTVTWGKDRERIAPGPDATVKRVCNACNNGWMSRLEDRAKPILGPMIMGDNIPITLAPSSQRTLASWALKTALMLDFLHSGSKPVFPASAYSSFFRDGQPSRRTAIWMACLWERRLRLFTSSQSIATADPPAYTREGVVVGGRAFENGSLCTLAAQAAVFQVALFPENSAPIRAVPDPRGAVHIWPPAHVAVNWPVNGTVYDDAALQAFSKRTVTISV